MDYQAFIAKKSIQPKPVGLAKVPKLPSFLKPFQRDITAWALRLGRAAVFAGTGLGKTAVQLAWADAVTNATKRPVLILTPLAVAHQTVEEAAKFGIDGVAYAAEQSQASSRIVVTNYDRVEKFDLSEFAGIVLDESSIIKSNDSKTRTMLIDLCREIAFKLCCTATPSPNDYTELGNHAEFLGVMTAKEMLATYFVHDGSIRATNAGNHGSKPIADWRLKRHAEREFWRWISTWAAVVGHPRDIGHEEPGYDLPPLRTHQITVPVEYKSSHDTGLLFPMEALTLSEQRAASRSSIDARVSAAVELVRNGGEGQWLIWTQLNAEADAVTSALKDYGAVNVQGSDDVEYKSKNLLGFAHGTVNILVSKPSLAGFGMNYQRCNRMIFVGLNNSFEQVFQALRRCWRFGQTKPVDAYMIAAETEGAVVANLMAKEEAAAHMLAQMQEHMKDMTKRALKGAEVRTFVEHKKKMEVPSWLA